MLWQDQPLAGQNFGFHQSLPTPGANRDDIPNGHIFSTSDNPHDWEPPLNIYPYVL